MFCKGHCSVATQLTFHETKMVCICFTHTKKNKNKQTKKPHKSTGYHLCLILVITVVLHDKSLFSYWHKLVHYHNLPHACHRFSLVLHMKKCGTKTDINKGFWENILHVIGKTNQSQTCVLMFQIHTCVTSFHPWKHSFCHVHVILRGYSQLDRQIFFARHWEKLVSNSWPFSVFLAIWNGQSPGKSLNTQTHESMIPLWLNYKH